MRRPLTRRGVATLCAGALIAAFGAVAGSQLLTAFGALLICTAVLSWLLARVLPVRLEVHRTVHPDLIRVGEHADMEMRITARTRIPVLLVWRDLGGVGVSSTARGVVRVSARAPQHVYYTFTAITRGRHTLGPCVFVLEDPFGLSRRELRTSATSDVWVAPSTEPVNPRRIGVGAAGYVSTQAPHRTAEAVADVIPRPFIPGDSVRRVHWRATAKSGELMVREDSRETTPELTILLDCAAERWAFAGTPTGPQHPFELAVAFATALALGAAPQGFSVTVMTDTGHTLDRLERNGGATRDFLRQIAELEQHGETGKPGGSAPHHGSLLIVTGEVTRAHADQLTLTHRRTRPGIVAASFAPGAHETLTHHGWRTVLLDDSIEDRTPATHRGGGET